MKYLCDGNDYMIIITIDPIQWELENPNTAIIVDSMDEVKSFILNNMKSKILVRCGSWVRNGFDGWEELHEFHKQYRDLL